MLLIGRVLYVVLRVVPTPPGLERYNAYTSHSQATRCYYVVYGYEVHVVTYITVH
jgi:hypothetical protein